MSKKTQKVKDKTEAILIINRYNEVKDKLNKLMYAFNISIETDTASRKLKKVFADLLDCEIDDICFNDYKPSKAGEKVCSYKYILGNANFENTKDLGDLRLISGSACFNESSVSDLKRLAYIGGSLDLRDSNVESFSNLHYIGRDLNMSCQPANKHSLVYNRTPQIDLGQLQHVGGDVDCRFSRVESLKNLEYVGGNLNLSWSRDTKELGKLTYVGGDLKIFQTEIKSLGSLNFVGGNAEIGCEVEDLGGLKYVVGKCTFFRDTANEDFDLSKMFIGGDALDKRRYLYRYY